MTKGDLESKFPGKQNTISDVRSCVRCAEPIEDYDFQAAEEDKQNSLILLDADLPLIDTVRISSSITKLETEHVMTLYPSVPPTYLGGIDTSTRALKPDTKDVIEEQKPSVLGCGDDTEVKLEDVGACASAGLVASIDDTSMKPISRSLTSKKLFQNHKSYWSSSESVLSSCGRIQSQELMLLESGDSSFNSSSSEDASVDFSQIKDNHSSPRCIMQNQESESCFSRKLEKLPKDAKEEVVKFLKGFSRAPLEWTSDTEESSDSEDSSVKEKNLSSKFTIEDYKVYADEEMREIGVRMDDNVINHTKHDPRDLCDGKTKNSENKEDYLTLSLLTDTWLPLSQQVHNMDREMNVHDDEDEVQSDGVFELGELTRTIAASESELDNTFQSGNRIKQPNKETDLPNRGQGAPETAWSNNEAGFSPKANDSCVDCGNVQTRTEISEDISGLVQNPQILSTKKTSGHDQDQETISYVPTMLGLVLEQLNKSSSSKKDDCRIEKPSEAMSDHTDPSSAAKVANVTSMFSFSEDGSSNLLTLNCLGTQLDLGNKLEMESELLVHTNTLKLLDPVVDDIKNTDLAPVSSSGIIPLSGVLSQSAIIPFSGSISLRSDSSNNSTRSFAFPILATEWNSSPVKMAPADRRYLRKKRQWSLCCFCCKRSTTKI